MLILHYAKAGMKKQVEYYLNSAATDFTVEKI